MNELHWPPEVLGRLTIAQLICLTNPKPPPPRPAATWGP
jgi:hypothetical protein